MLVRHWTAINDGDSTRTGDWKETADLFEQVGCDDAARWLSVEVELNVHVLAKAKGRKGVGESARHSKNR